MSEKNKDKVIEDYEKLMELIRKNTNKTTDVPFNIDSKNIEELFKGFNIKKDK